jgi:hypothetical protein
VLGQSVRQYSHTLFTVVEILGRALTKNLDERTSPPFVILHKVTPITLAMCLASSIRVLLVGCL